MKCGIPILFMRNGAKEMFQMQTQIQDSNSNADSRFKKNFD